MRFIVHPRCFRFHCPNMDFSENPGSDLMMIIGFFLPIYFCIYFCFKKTTLASFRCLYCRVRHLTSRYINCHAAYDSGFHRSSSGSVGLVLYYWCGDHHSMSHWINQPTVESTRGASLLHHAFRLIFWLIQRLFDWWPCGRIEQWATNLNPVVQMYILTKKLKGLDSNIDISQGWGADIEYLATKNKSNKKLFQKKKSLCDIALGIFYE